ncbi:MAG: NAD(+)/NADH kinase, partial [Deltaproteobacteria bacterium]
SMKLGIVAKMTNPEAIRLSGEVAAWLKERGIEVYGDTELAKRANNITACDRKDLADLIDSMVVLGGDGTILYAARLLSGKKITVLGVNMGGLGFLTTVKVNEVYENLEKLIKGDYTLEERMMLSVVITRDEKKYAEYKVLNDVVIKSRMARLIKLATSINKEYVTTYRSDGLIIATPTGSTAYALSAGGPILYPTIHSIIVVPICPFNLMNRPVVVPDWMSVDVSVPPDDSALALTLDGQVDMQLKAGDSIEVKRAAESVYVVAGKGKGKGYFDILRERLLWEGKKEGQA